MISDLMAGDESSELFTGDNDPQLVKDALPFILKMYEMLAEKNPKNSDLLLSTGKTFVMYSNIFIQTPANMLPDEQYLDQFKMLRRSKKMYQRGVEYILRAIELKHKNFRVQLEEGEIDTILNEMDQDDIPYLYWAASGMLGEFTCDPFDFSLGSGLYKPVAFLYRALEIDETYDNGALHDLLIMINASLPEALMYKKIEGAISETADYTAGYYGELNLLTPSDKSRYHFERAVEIAGGRSSSPYLSLATTVSVNEQNYEEFQSLLNTALEIDPELIPEMRLAGVIYRDKAQWLLDHASNFFLLDFNEGDF